MQPSKQRSIKYYILFTDKEKKTSTIPFGELCGTLDIILNRNSFYGLTAHHKVIHELDRNRYAVSGKLNQAISKLAVGGLTPAQILLKLRGEGQHHLTWSAVHYIWREAVKHNFMFHDDPYESVIEGVNRASHLSLVMHHTARFSLAVKTSIGDIVLSKFDCTKVFIDSTLKTNRSKLELFTVIVSVCGTGFPVSYLLLEQCTDENRRMDMLTVFLKSLKVNLPNLKPVFFFTDKDKGQMKAISEVYQLVPSLCYWHMKRAVKRRLAKFRSQEDMKFSKEDEKKLMFIISRHFNIHPFFCGQSIDQIYAWACVEIKSKYDTAEHGPLYSYLMDNWYGYDGRLSLSWERRNPSHIPFVRTTMFVEGHWSTLKKNYLILHNRPRIDFLLYILDAKLLPKFIGSYYLLIDGKQHPAWYKAMVKEWREKGQRDASGVPYQTNFIAWVSNCPSFSLSKFLLYKNLVRGIEPPMCRDIEINGMPTFWIFRKEADRRYPRVEKEKEGWNNEREMVLSGCTEVKFFIPPSEESPTKTDTDEKVRGIADWFHYHVQELSGNVAGREQMSYIYKNIIPELAEYRSSVEKKFE